MKTYQAGESTRQLAAQRRGKHRSLTLLFVVCALGLMVASFSMSAWGMGIAGIVVLLAGRFILGAIEGAARREKKRERNAVRGAVAEESIGKILESLPDALILHDVRSPYGNVDHVVITPNGTFLIETKSHKGRVSVIDGQLRINGQPPEKDFIKQTLRNTYWLKGEIERISQAETWITPILVFSAAFVEGKATTKGIQILNKKFLAPTIQRQRGTNPAWPHREEISKGIRSVTFHPRSNNQR